jgi:hypothetical protein
VTKYKCHVNDRQRIAKKTRALMTSGYTDIVREKHEIGFTNYVYAPTFIYSEIHIPFDLKDLNTYIGFKNELKENDSKTSYFVSTGDSGKGWLTARFSNHGIEDYNDHVNPTLNKLQKKFNLPYLKVEAAIYDTNLKYDEEWLNKE